MTGKKKQPRTFSERLDALSRLVEELEGGELSLEESILRFEEGKALEKELLQELASYEKRLEKILKDDGVEGSGQEPAGGGLPGEDAGGEA